MLVYLNKIIIPIYNEQDVIIQDNHICIYGYFKHFGHYCFHMKVYPTSNIRFSGDIDDGYLQFGQENIFDSMLTLLFLYFS